MHHSHDSIFWAVGDDQVKLRGQRLEIGEINHAIRSVPRIQDAATVVVPHLTSKKDILVSFIVEKSDRSASLEFIPDIDGLMKYSWGYFTTYRVWIWLIKKRSYENGLFDRFMSIENSSYMF